MIGGHGHVTPRPDGKLARCGGPRICAECALELAQQARATEPLPDSPAARILADDKASLKRIAWGYAMAARGSRTETLLLERLLIAAVAVNG